MSSATGGRLVLTDQDVASIATELGLDIRSDEIHEVAVRLASTVEQLRSVMQMDLSAVVPVVVLPDLG